MLKVSSDLLVNVFLRPTSALNLSLQEWESLLLVLRKAQLLARIGELLHHHEIMDKLPLQVQRHFANAITLANRQALQVNFEADVVSSYLQQRASMLIFLKGAGYTLSQCPASLGRVFSDIDILVDKESLKEVERSLAVAGWFSQEITDYDDRYYREWTHEIPPVAHGIRGTVLDIHHNIVPPVSGRAIDVKALIKGKVEVKPGVYVLAPPAMTMHSVIHLFFNEDFTSSFRDLTDLYLLMNNRPCEYWLELFELARTIQFETELVYTIRYLVKLFQMPITAEMETFLAYRPIRFAWLKDFIFTRTLLPEHHLIDIQWSKTARFLAFVRGHWLKMPFTRLCKHFTTKSYRAITEAILGEHHFTKREREELSQYRNKMN